MDKEMDYAFIEKMDMSHRFRVHVVCQNMET